MTLFDRATRALVDDLSRQANLDGPDAPHIYDDTLPESVGIDGRVDCTALVRAVIKAISEPSEAMTLTVDEAANGHGDYIWSTMIDTLLEEER